MMYVVMADTQKKEHYIEYLSDREYDIAVNEEKPTRIMQSVFSTFKEAEKEATRISKTSFVSGWSYNKERNKNQ